MNRLECHSIFRCEQMTIQAPDPDYSISHNSKTLLIIQTISEVFIELFFQFYFSKILIFFFFQIQDKIKFYLPQKEFIQIRCLNQSNTKLTSWNVEFHIHVYLNQIFILVRF